MKIAAFTLLFGTVSVVSAQDMTTYKVLVHQADSLYHAKDFLGSAEHYSSAFASMAGAGTMDDLYNAACAWALANEPDSAFYRLTRLAGRVEFQDVGLITADADLVSLHAARSGGL